MEGDDFDVLTNDFFKFFLSIYWCNFFFIYVCL